MSGARRSDPGFTLLEILLALALVGLVLVGLNTFIFSMGELWGRNADVRLFDQHVNAVTRFLGQQLRTATLPPAARANATPVTPKQVTPANGAAGKLITFELPAGCRIISWPDRPLPEVVCSLQVRDRLGLFLLWHSRLETHFDTDPPHEMLLTPFVTALAYDYFDTNVKNWTTETTVRNNANGQPLPPQRLHLTFTYGKLSRQTTVPVPTTLQGMPNF
ncbi:MAG: prepilin-type N-terminal cleavage/methylation domain-containing protein [Opitutaceae bacterium]|jgi:prepilin-type N-terminal cleavage/methylation domain-containing protein